MDESVNPGADKHWFLPAVLRAILWLNRLKVDSKQGSACAAKEVFEILTPRTSVLLSSVSGDLLNVQDLFGLQTVHARVS